MVLPVKGTTQTGSPTAILSMSSFLLPHLFKLYPGVTSQRPARLIKPTDMFSLALEVLKNTIPIRMSFSTFGLYFPVEAKHTPLPWSQGSIFGSHLPSPKNC